MPQTSQARLAADTVSSSTKPRQATLAGPRLIMPAAANLAVMPAAIARTQSKLTYGSAYRQLIAATDSPQLDRSQT